MKRRDFIKNSSLASGLFLVPSFLKSIEFIDPKALGYKKLVVIQLSGGNDGLNTVVPYRNDIYYKNRPSLAVSKSNLIDVNGEMGFHKSLV